MADIDDAGATAGGVPGGSPLGVAAADAAVEREGDLWLIGGEMPPAWRLAVWRGDGAALWWDVASPDASCGVLVTDASAAAPWIGDISGPDVARLLLGRESPAATVPLARQTQLALKARDAAIARWRQAWWPASREALVPPLDPRLMAAERAVALRDLGGLSVLPMRSFAGRGFLAVSGGAHAPTGGAHAATDPANRDALEARARTAGLLDDAAVDAALRELAAAEQRFGRLPEPREDPDGEPGTEPDPPTHSPLHLARHAHALAASRGVATPDGSAGDVADSALGRAPDPVRASIGGVVEIDLSYTPNGVVDATAEARWRVAFTGAAATIIVEVVAAPRFANEPPLEPNLHASFAGVNAPLALADGVWRAEQPVPLTMLTDPPADRTLLLYVPGHDKQRPSPDASQLIRIARARMIAPTSPSEAEGAAREIR